MLFILLFIPHCQAQDSGATVQQSEPTYTRAWEVRHDNDFLQFTDRYYTSGTFLGLISNFESDKDSITSYQYKFYIRQEIYTPADLEETDPDRIGRPYAGFMGFDNTLMVFKEQRSFEYQLYLGWSGPQSLAENFQNAFHSTGAQDSRIASWEDQIANTMHANAYFTYLREWKMAPNPFAVHISMRPKAAFGTRDVYGQYGMSFMFGRRDDFKTTSAYGHYGSSREWYFSVDLRYRYVLHDATFEGSLAGDRSTLTRQVYPNLFLYDFMLVHRRNRNVYRIGYQYHLAKRRNIEPHLYMQFSFTRYY